MRQVKLTQGKFALVDDEDFDWINQWNWHYNKAGYAVRNKLVNKKWIGYKMHILINNTPNNLQTDHINGNRLDNQRANLRSCTAQENAKNRKKNSNSPSPYKGVLWWEYYGRPGKWTATIRHNKKDYFIGVYKTSIEAAVAYNAKAVELHGEFAKLNEV